MSKRRFVLPYVTLSGGLTDDGDVTVIGGGSGQSGVDPLTTPSPCSFAYWKDSDWAEDLVGEGNGIDEYDFAAWWDGNEFTRQDWEKLNPDLPWDDYFE